MVYKFKPFNLAGDMEDPKFKVCMVFDSVEILRTTMSQYAVKNRVQIIKPRNNKKMFEAHCAGKGCSWKLIPVRIT